MTSQVWESFRQKGPISFFLDQLHRFHCDRDSLMDSLDQLSVGMEEGDDDISVGSHHIDHKLGQ